jgi:AcrR family transcriptional regulator
MARNKYPEETEKLIREVSLRLFVQKGYENTSIQDIIGELGGLSKGAIYYHFKSKEDILMGIMHQMDQEISLPLIRVRDDPTKNGFEKLKEMFRVSLLNSDKEVAFQTAPDLRKNPKMMALQIDSIFKEVVPLYILPIIETGVADGSIETEYPRELAEIIILLSNLWLNPLMFAEEDLEAVMVRRSEFYQILLRKMGLDLFDDEMMERFRYLGNLYYGKGKEKKK